MACKLRDPADVDAMGTVKDEKRREFSNQHGGKAS